MLRWHLNFIHAMYQWFWWWNRKIYKNWYVSQNPALPMAATKFTLFRKCLWNKEIVFCWRWFIQWLPRPGCVLIPQDVFLMKIHFYFLLKCVKFVLHSACRLNMHVFSIFTEFLPHLVLRVIINKRPLWNLDADLQWALSLE